MAVNRQADQEASGGAAAARLRGRGGPQRLAPRNQRPGGGRGPDAHGRFLFGKRPVFRFVLLFALLMGLFYLVDSTAYARKVLFPSYLRLNASASGGILSWFEESLTVTGQSIRSPRYSLSIERGCDAVEPSALFLAGVIAFPAPFIAKIPGMLIGTFCLMAINLLRIVTLFYVGVYWPSAFHTAHVDVWQPLFIFLAILFWTLWALWATRPGERKANVRAARN